MKDRSLGRGYGDRNTDNWVGVMANEIQTTGYGLWRMKYRRLGMGYGE